MIIEEKDTVEFIKKIPACDICKERFELVGWKGNQCSICLRSTHHACGADTTRAGFSLPRVWLCNACLAIEGYAEQLAALEKQKYETRREWAERSLKAQTEETA